MRAARDVSELTMPAIDRVTHLVDKINVNSAKVYIVLVVTDTANMHDQFIEVSMGDRTVKCVIDTGAQISCVGQPLIGEMQLTLLPIEPETAPIVHGVSSTAINILGKANITFMIGTEEMTYPFYVLEHCHVEMIMGLDILKAKKALVDVDNQRYYLETLHLWRQCCMRALA